jgi:hypothetical protein
MIGRRRVVPAVAAPKLSPVEAAERLARVADTVERLTRLILQETRLVRAGAYDAAAALAVAKGELSGRYMLDVDGLSSNAEAVAAQPRVAIDGLENLHVAFRAALDENLAVLGTARSVAESLLRGVAEEVGQRSQPKTYDARGGAYDSRSAVAPISLSRGA